jgi:hypothetical protein
VFTSESSSPQKLRLLLLFCRPQCGHLVWPFRAPSGAAHPPTCPDSARERAWPGQALECVPAGRPSSRPGLASPRPDRPCSLSSGVTSLGPRSRAASWPRLEMLSISTCPQDPGATKCVFLETQPSKGRISSSGTEVPDAAALVPTPMPTVQPAGAAPFPLHLPRVLCSARGPAVGRPHLLAGKRGSGLAPYHPGPEALFRMVSW